MEQKQGQQQQQQYPDSSYEYFQKNEDLLFETIFQKCTRLKLINKFEPNIYIHATPNMHISEKFLQEPSGYSLSVHADMSVKSFFVDLLPSMAKNSINGLRAVYILATNISIKEKNVIIEKFTEFIKTIKENKKFYDTSVANDPGYHKKIDHSSIEFILGTHGTSIGLYESKRLFDDGSVDDSIILIIQNHYSSPQLDLLISNTTKTSDVENRSETGQPNNNNTNNNNNNKLREMTLRELVASVEYQESVRFNDSQSDKLAFYIYHYCFYNNDSNNKPVFSNDDVDKRTLPRSQSNANTTTTTTTKNTFKAFKTDRYNVFEKRQNDYLTFFFQCTSRYEYQKNLKKDFLIGLGPSNGFTWIFPKEKSVVEDDKNQESRQQKQFTPFTNDEKVHNNFLLPWQNSVWPFGVNRKENDIKTLETAIKTPNSKVWWNSACPNWYANNFLYEVLTPNSKFNEILPEFGLNYMTSSVTKLQPLFVLINSPKRLAEDPNLDIKHWIHFSQKMYSEEMLLLPRNHSSLKNFFQQYSKHSEFKLVPDLISNEKEGKTLIAFNKKNFLTLMEWK